MHDPEPVTHWLSRARAGDEEALRKLWRHYFQRLARLARGRMAVLSRSVYDEEDAALSAMHSFFRGMKEDRFPQLDGRHNLWRLLVVIVSRKISRRRQMATAGKRGGDATTDAGLLDALDREPTPDFVAEMLDDLQQRLASLPDHGLRRIALFTLDGLTQAEIAQAMNCTVRTIHRKLDTIRAVWEDAPP